MVVPGDLTEEASTALRKNQVPHSAPKETVADVPGVGYHSWVMPGSGN